jgi:predicted AAA+ superfamily ATPase
MTIKPWREVAHPHKDVLEGTFKQSEFAADISQVHAGTATPEYQDAEKFFARTFITEGMRHLLMSVAERLSGRGGDPVIQLQTAFGGGKTHTLLAVYHLASRQCPTEKLSGIPPILDAAGVASLPVARVAVIDGIKFSPSLPRSHSGITVNTLWGDLAVQLLGAEGYALLAEADLAGTSPGKDALTTLLQRAAPCVLLLDELVAYVRQLEPGKSYPGGTFDSNITFIQALTEAMKGVPNAMLLASLPESETEAAGTQGQRALDVLEKNFARVESVWKPVAAEESFEIVRRRLFDDVGDAVQVRATARAYGELYRHNPSKFPADALEARYEERIANAYPIHPEVFDRLYEDWSTLDKFQRTRGVLQYMAIVIHRLWNSNDKDPLIMPGSIPLDDAVVRNKSVHYLPNGWEPVIEREVDGPRSAAMDIDGHDTRFGSVQAARRVARTIFLGSAPSNAQQSVRGIRVEGILLGVAQPGQAVGTYEDVVKRLRDRLHYLYGEKDSYWFDTRPNLRREMESRKANLKDADDVLPVIRERVGRVFSKSNHFAGIHVFTPSSDVPDDFGLGPRLVLLPPTAGYRRNDEATAIHAATELLEKRGDAPRLKRNRLIFLAPDADAVQRLRDSVRTYLAWKSIVDDVQNRRMDLGTYQADQAKRAMDTAEDGLKQMVRETYRWLMVPTEEMQRGKLVLRWEAVSVSPSAPSLVDEIENKLKEEEWVVYAWSPVHLNRLLEQWYFKDGRVDVPALKVWQDCCQYLYLPRLLNSDVFVQAITAGCAKTDGFAFASAREGEHWLGFTFGHSALVTLDADSLLVSHDAASGHQRKLEETRRAQAEAEAVQAAARALHNSNPASTSIAQGGQSQPIVTAPHKFNSVGAPAAENTPASLPKRFVGVVELDADSATMDFSKVAAEVIQHFSVQLGVTVKITVELEASSSVGFDAAVQRTVKENCGVLKFRLAEFERE